MPIDPEQIAGTQITWEPTPHLRWVFERPHQNAKKILQQKWENRASQTTEWRNVDGT